MRDIYQCGVIVDEIMSLEKQLFDLKQAKATSSVLTVVQAKINDKKDEYLKTGCIDDLQLSACADMEYKITMLQSTVNSLYAKGDTINAEMYNRYLTQVKADYATKGCDAKIQQFRNIPMQNTIAKYQNLDEQRITSLSVTERNKRLFFGGLILLGALTVLLSFGSDKNVQQD